MLPKDPQSGIRGPRAHDNAPSSSDSASDASRKSVLKDVLRRLRRQHGRRRWTPDGSAVDVLVETVLSQNTSGANRRAGYERLTAKFETWDAVADASVTGIEKCIRVCGLSRTKAPRIRAILRGIRRQHGRINLEFLRDLPPTEAYERLLTFDGVGPKTAYCVLMFSFGMPVFPVDTHIHRIAIRLGLLTPKTSADRAHDLLTPLIPPKSRYEMHLLLIAHGRGICRARNPRCEVCPLLSLCPFGSRRMEDLLDADDSTEEDADKDEQG